MWVAMIECSMDYGVTTRYRSCMYNTYGKNSVETNDPVFTRCGVWRQLQVAAEKQIFSHSGACMDTYVSFCNCANSDTQDRILRWESSKGCWRWGKLSRYVGRWTSPITLWRYMNWLFGVNISTVYFAYSKNFPGGQDVYVLQLERSPTTESLLDVDRQGSAY